MLCFNPVKEASQFLEGSPIRVDFTDFVEIKMWKFSLSDKVLEVTFIQMAIKRQQVTSPQRIVCLPYLMCFSSTNLFYYLLNGSL